MNTRHTNIIKSILSLFICVLVGFLLGGGVVYHFINKSPQIERIIVRDTIVQTDTITHTKIIKQDRYYYDTIMLRDTVWIANIPQTYTDSCEDYKIDINAVKLYDYSLDIYRVDTFIKEIEKVPQIERKGGWCWSVNAGMQVGYGLIVNPYNMQANFSPYIGVGVSFGFGYKLK